MIKILLVAAAVAAVAVVAVVWFRDMLAMIIEIEKDKEW